jgi:hypothetical protein
MIKIYLKKFHHTPYLFPKMCEKNHTYILSVSSQIPYLARNRQVDLSFSYSVHKELSNASEMMRKSKAIQDIESARKLRKEPLLLPVLIRRSRPTRPREPQRVVLQLLNSVHKLHDPKPSTSVFCPDLN